MKPLVSKLLSSLLALSATAACAQSATNDSFESAVSLVNQHSRVIVLTAGDAAIAVWPAMQGRVLTSTADGLGGRGFGWVNRELIASGKVQPHINTVGGEDRLWLGPEGGQYSIFFAPGAPFDLAHWYTPPAFDTEPFETVGQSATSVAFRRRVQLTNYSGTHFDVQIDRKVRLLTPAEVTAHLHVTPARDVKSVGYESENTLTNIATTPMEKATGVLSLWVLGQFRAAPRATIILPIKPGPEAQLGRPVKTDYFGPVPADRVRIEASAVLFRADARFRSKLGVSPQRSKGVIGSYDPEHHTLTIVEYNQQPGAAYVNSAWQIQKDPYAGDVANCYNDGVPSPGKPQLGEFYELESSSPAEALAPHGTVEHTQRTIHMVGEEGELDRISRTVLGIPLADVDQFSGSK